MLGDSRFNLDLLEALGVNDDVIMSRAAAADGDTTLDEARGC